MKPFDGQQGRGHHGTFKQAADSVPWRRTSGRVVAHASSACAQRGAQAQPEKPWLIGGGVPTIVGRGPSRGRSMRAVQRTAERREGQEVVSECTHGWAASHHKETITT